VSGAELLTAGKAVLWFAVPLALAVRELRRTRRLLRAPADDHARPEPPDPQGRTE
jgi:hypothetical protein